MMSNPEPNRISRLISMKDAAEYLGVSTSTIERLADAGKITRVRISSRSKYTYEDLDDFIARSTQKARA
jgi:excisionase family DNA binding protein